MPFIVEFRKQKARMLEQERIRREEALKAENIVKEQIQAKLETERIEQEQREQARQEAMDYMEQLFDVERSWEAREACKSTVKMTLKCPVLERRLEEFSG